MLRLLSLAVAVFTVLTLAAMAVIQVLTSPDAAPARQVAPDVLASPEPAGPVAPLVVLPPPAAGAPAAPPARVTVEVQPPPVAVEPEQRSAELLAFREVRRADAMDQLNAREARRRARLGLPPPPPAQARPVSPAARRGTASRFTAP